MGIQVKPFFELFKQGKEVANSAAWKNGTISVNAVAGVLGAVAAIAGGFGYDFNLSEETLQQAAAGAVAVVGIVNAVMHVVTSKKVGLPSNGGIDVSEMSVEDVERMVANREIPPFVVGVSCDF